MFHNGGYAKCDVALPTQAISMGYSILSGVCTRSRDYANPCRPGACVVDGQGGALAPGGPAHSDPGGEIRATDLTAGNQPTHFPPKAPGSDFSFWPKNLGVW